MCAGEGRCFSRLGYHVVARYQDVRRCVSRSLFPDFLVINVRATV